MKLNSKVEKILKIYLLSTIIFGGTSILFPRKVNPYDKDGLNIARYNFMEDFSGLENTMNIKLDDNNREDFVIFNSVIENINLNNEEKKYLYELFPIIQDNKYLNKKRLYDVLLGLDIKYLNEYDMGDKGGLYKALYNDICLHQDYDSKRDKEIFMHEAIHATFNNTIHFGHNFFVEGMTELLNNEYYSEDPFYEVNTYPGYIAFCKAIIDLVGEDIAMKAYTENSFNLVSMSISNMCNKNKDIMNAMDVFIEGLDLESDVTFSNKEVADACNILNRFGSEHLSGDRLESYRYNLNLASEVINDPDCVRYFNTLNNHGVYEKAYYNTDLLKDYSDYKLVKSNERSKVKVNKRY